MTFEGMPEGYGALLTDLKERIRSAQVLPSVAQLEMALNEITEITEGKGGTIAE